MFLDKTKINDSDLIRNLKIVFASVFACYLIFSYSTEYKIKWLNYIRMTGLTTLSILCILEQRKVKISDLESIPITDMDSDISEELSNLRSKYVQIFKSLVNQNNTLFRLDSKEFYRFNSGIIDTINPISVDTIYSYLEIFQDVFHSHLNRKVSLRLEITALAGVTQGKIHKHRSYYSKIINLNSGKQAIIKSLFDPEIQRKSKEGQNPIHSFEYSEVIFIFGINGEIEEIYVLSSWTQDPIKTLEFAIRDIAIEQKAFSLMSFLNSNVFIKLNDTPKLTIRDISQTSN